LNIFDKIVEEIIDSKKQDIIKKIHSLTNEDWGNIISQCKMRYVNADNGSLRDMCRKNSFIEDMETEYLLQKQTEIREKVIDYIDF
jgi:chromosome condensin MukBEF complex kleisin-like MukF subunit